MSKNIEGNNKELEESLYDNHIKLGLQHINDAVFDDIIMKGKYKYPAVQIETETIPGKHTFNSIKNSINLKQGDHYLYFVIDDRSQCIGKIDLNIEIVSRLENLLRRLKPTITLCKDISNDFSHITSLDLIHTMEIDLEIGDG